jgi:1-deoxy-D-xylulose-5-phosphate synthase
VLATADTSVVAITAAMPAGTGTSVFASAIPDRFFDVGIAEGHAVTFAAGLATRDIKPVVAIYSTFLQRAYDNVIHDVALQALPVVFCMDRAGLVGEDGPTHMGLYDIAYMLAVPGMTVAAPKNGTEMLALLRTGLAHTGGPFCLRYPRDASPDVPPAATEIPPVPYGTWEVLRQGHDVAILAVGTMVLPALAAAEALAADGIDPTVVNCRFLKPFDEVTLTAVIGQHPHVLVVEEGTMVNGFGAYMSTVIAQIDPAVRVGVHGVPDRYIEQAPRKVQLALTGLDSAGIARRVRALLETEAVAG